MCASPWYRDTDKYLQTVDKYLSSVRSLPRTAKQHLQIRAYAEFSAYRMIFESNLIEGVGLGLQETQKLVKQEFPQLPDTYRHFLNAYPNHGDFHTNQLTSEKFRRMIAVADELKAAGRNIQLSVSHKDRSRPFMEVVQHNLAYRYIIARIYEFIHDETIVEWYAFYARIAQIRPGDPNARKKIRAVIKKRGLSLEDFNDLWSKLAETGMSPGEKPRLITEDFIRTVHSKMMDGLLPEDCNVAPGEYRTDERRAGWEHVYPTPEVIPDMMQKFIQLANEVIHSNIHPVEMAAKISYSFVRIHPFPDGNGRMSRLLMGMALRVRGVPFVVSIRGDSKGKKRYHDALTRGPKDKLSAMSNLIARSIIAAFEEIEDSFQLAGWPSLLTSSD